MRRRKIIINRSRGSYTIVPGGSLLNIGAIRSQQRKNGSSIDNDIARPRFDTSNADERGVDNEDPIAAVANIGSQPATRANEISLNEYIGGTKNLNAVAKISGDEVSCLGIRPADKRFVFNVDIDAGFDVSKPQGARDIGADKVSSDKISAVERAEFNSVAAEAIDGQTFNDAAAGVL